MSGQRTANWLDNSMELRMGNDLDEWTYLRTAIELDESMELRMGNELDERTANRLEDSMELRMGNDLNERIANGELVGKLHGTADGGRLG